MKTYIENGLKAGPAIFSAMLLLLPLLLPFASPNRTQSRNSGLANEACPPLPPPSGNTVEVSTVAQLQSAVNSAASGDTILVADGVYSLPGGVYLQFDVPDVTLRSASGNREAVVLDGNYATTEIVQIVASNVTIADLTLREAYYHPIHVMSTAGGPTNGALIYNVHIVDPREQAIKINPGYLSSYYVDDGVVACSHIELTDAGRPHVNPTAGGCYTGGVDAHQAQGWVIRDNLIEGFWCPTGLSEHGVHFWRSCRGTIVERNVLRDNARGIGFGMAAEGDARTYPDDPCPSAGGGYVDHYDGVIRNNFVFASRSELFASDASFDCGICLWQACGAQVLHNSVASTQAPFSSIEWRFSRTDVEIVNNLVTHNLMERNSAAATLAGNLPEAPLSLFVDGPGGDLHLAEGADAAIDQAVAVAAGLCDDDVDGETRPIGDARDVGADEYGSPPPAAVTDLRVTEGVTSAGVLTATLRWTAPSGGVTATLRYSGTLITDNNWSSAMLLTDTLSSAAGVYTASLPYSSGTVYFGLKSQSVEDVWADLSNIGFWPRRDIHLPLILRSH